MKQYEVYPGARIGRLTVVAPIKNSILPKWRCQCDCGRVRLVLERNLINGHTPGCDCHRDDPTEKAKSEECQKTDCRHWSSSGCTYFIATGHTRTFLHLGEDIDINNPCREYSPGEKNLFRTKPFTLGEDYK